MSVAVGDVYEVPVSTGFGYAQCVLKHWKYGELMRVYDDVLERPLKRAEDLASARERFRAFVMMSTRGISSRGLRMVGRLEVPADARPIGWFRNAVLLPGTSEILRWQLWDGTDYSPLPMLTEEARRLPILEVITVDLLCRRIESGWVPAQDPDPAATLAPRPRPRPAGLEAQLTFGGEASAQSAYRESRDHGFNSRVDGSRLRVSLSTSDPHAIAKSREWLADLAVRHHGEIEDFGVLFEASDRPN